MISIRAARPAAFVNRRVKAHSVNMRLSCGLFLETTAHIKSHRRVHHNNVFSSATAWTQQSTKRRAGIALQAFRGIVRRPEINRCSARPQNAGIGGFADELTGTSRDATIIITRCACLNVSLLLFSLPVSFIYTQARLSHFEIVFKHYNSIST
jgi:hypothetical protein